MVANCASDVTPTFASDVTPTFASVKNTDVKMIEMGMKNIGLTRH